MMGWFIRYRGWFTLMLLWCAHSIAADVRAYVDRSVITENDTLNFVIEAPDRDATPELDPLDNDFNILNTGRSDRVSIVNGRVESKNEWVLTLAPKRSGELHIPALRVGHATTAPITVKVVADSGAPGNDRDVFVEASVAESDVYVQAQLIYTVRLYHAVDLQEGALTLAKFPNAIIERLGDDKTGEVVRAGRRYQYVERNYAIFPQTSGSLKIPPAEFSGKVAGRGGSAFDNFFMRRFGNDPFDQMFATGQSVRARSKEISVNILPQIADTQSAWWLPATKLELSEEWAPNPPRTDVASAAAHVGVRERPPAFRVGEPVTRTIILNVDGLTADQLPDIAPGDVPGLKQYPDQPVKDTTPSADGVVAKKTQKIAYVATHAGHVNIPPIEIPWWDTQHKRLEKAVIPAQTIDVLPALGDAAAPPPSIQPAAVLEARARASNAVTTPIDTSQSVPAPAFNYWAVVSAVAIAAWLLTLLAWWRGRSAAGAAVSRASQETPDAVSLKTARAQVTQACASGNAAQLRNALLAWAACVWTDAPPLTLSALAARSSQDKVRKAVLDLERRLYASAPRGTLEKDACDVLQRWVTEKMQPVAAAARNVALRPLYPSG